MSIQGFSFDSGSSSLLEGEITAAPATIHDLVRVQTDEGNDLGLLRWMHDGSNLPTVGDGCLVALTSSGTAWVASWWPN